MELPTTEQGWKDYFTERYGTPEGKAADIWKIMDELGFARAELTYDGGNDEGGIQSIESLTLKDGTVLTSGLVPNLNWQDPFWQACDALLSTKYYSWDGDWRAHGTLHVWADEKRAWTEGYKQVFVEADDEDTISVNEPDES